MSRSKEEWTNVLDGIEASLAQSLERLPALDAAPAELPHASRADSLAALELRLGEMQASLERAEQCATETDAQLQAEAEAMRGWSEAIKKFRVKLSNQTQPVD